MNQDNVQQIGLKMDEVAIYLGVSRMQVYKMRADGVLPSPIVMGRRCVRWDRRDIDAWIEANKRRGC